MKKLNTETLVGLFVIIGFACFAFIAIKLGDVDILNQNVYELSGRFSSVSGLKAGSPVELAGVRIGAVEKIEIDPEEYEAIAYFTIINGLYFPIDSIASIRTSGIIGDKFIKITPGGEEEFLADGDSFEETESAISIEELVSKYIFEKD